MPLNSQQTERTEHTMSGSFMNLLAVTFIIPIFIIIGIPYILLHGYYNLHLGLTVFVDYLIIILPLGIVIHELLHATVWAAFAQKGFSSIKFGFNTKALAPYCHCKEPLKVWSYRLGGAMPGLVMGGIPSLVALITGSGFLIVFGIFFTWAAAGDMMALWMLRKFDKYTEVQDHPDKMGFYVMKNH